MFENLDESRMGVARMQKERFSKVQTQLELGHEPFLLVGMRRVVAVEVQPALADRHAARMRAELS
jgi:hypothetical protein